MPPLFSLPKATKKQSADVPAPEHMDVTCLFLQLGTPVEAQQITVSAMGITHYFYLPPASFSYLGGVLQFQRNACFPPLG